MSLTAKILILAALLAVGITFLAILFMRDVRKNKRDKR